MNKFFILVLLIVVSFSQAQTLTNTFTYQGKLKFNNALANGPFDFEFNVFDVATNGSLLETVVVEDVTVTNGVFTTPITLTNDLFTGNKIWLDIGVRVGTTTDPFDPLSPRQEVTSSPYAIHAQFVGADAVTGVQIQNGTITASDVDTSSLQQRVGGSCASGQYMKSVNANGSVVCTGNTISTSGSSPFTIKVNSKTVLTIEDRVDASLPNTHVPNVIVGSNGNTYVGNHRGVSIFGGNYNRVFSDYSTVVGGRSNSAGDFSGTNMFASVFGGLSNSARGQYSTVLGGFYNLAGGDYSLAIGKYASVRDASVTGDANGDEGTFIWSDATANSANKFTSSGPNQFLIRATGGVGIGTNNPNGYQLNVFGSSYLRNSADTSTGADLVLGGGTANATDDGVLTSDLTVAGSDLFIKSNDAVLIFVDANEDGDVGNFKVRTTSGTTLFEVLETGVVNIPGSLNVTGSVSKASGTFKIDHPLDPENKYLYHSFVESPDMMNVYNGNITTDKHGEAWVELPEYFEALNRDFRYQLTVIGSFARAMVAEEITGNQFLIKTDESNIKVSWQITGIRQDAYAEKNRIQVEVDKPASEKGSYLYPTVWENN